MHYEMIKATKDNDVLKCCTEAWQDILISQKEDAATEYYEMRLSQAHDILHNRDDHHAKVYALYFLVEKDAEHNILGYHGFVHTNHMHPKTTSATLRLVWNVLSPAISPDNTSEQLYSKLLTSYVFGALKLCLKEFKSFEMKMYLENMHDRVIAQTVCSVLEAVSEKYEPKIAGNWLHVKPSL